ncbi:methyltransferase domain-containing protein [Mesobacterium sp. TK19101]|uniref:Methyltransferase domain-containing protein n=1 Tax=Mesobacterium hydrothermale TaxID=3111907 RepID=A0ABU6HBQ1_9RHOB|nr:methyltransferase domain-containing protein [Mesobacterium sp. TK19101]MEC3859893.1 methyltransferase domain-containing protein [Mesobacterium sp. TK19101]
MRDAPFTTDELTCDDFLGGRARVWQPRNGYRAGTDPVLLAAAVTAKPGQTVLELGCGGGPALVCLGTRVPGLHLTGVELQPGYADLARRNLAENALDGTIETADLTALPGHVRQVQFDHVFANPPYFQASTRKGATAADREIALAGQTPLAQWVEIAAKRLAPGGTATFIQRAERLPELLTHFTAHLGSVELLPLAPRPNRPPRLILLRGRRAGRAPFRFHAPLILHRATDHQPDANPYSAPVNAVMRDAAALPFPDDKTPL